MKNVVLIIADQMRWDVLPCNGADFIKAPNFDRLAGRSVNFSCAYSGNPVCVPARGIIATGCYSHNCMDPAARNDNAGEILPRHTHIARHFGNNGYRTYGTGKCHCLPYKRNPGFEVFEVAEEGRIELQKEQGLLTEKVKEDYLVYLERCGYGGMQRAHGIGNNDPRAGASPLALEHYVDTWATTRSLELLQRHLKETPREPFYLQLGFVKPHAPYDPPEPFNKMYNPAEIPKPRGSGEDLKGRNPMMALCRKMYLVDRMSEMAIQYSRAHYFGLISYLDGQLGRVLDFLEANNIIDETLIVFTADHGDNIGDHGLFFKTFFTEGSARVPLLISLGGATPKGATYDCLVGQEDIMPTVCELAGLPIPSGIDGISLSGQIQNPSGERRPFVVSQFFSGDGLALMIRNKQYKYCFARYESTEELYDMLADPGELNNLATASRFKDVLLQMRGLADNWCRSNNHEPILTDDGKLTYSKFDFSEHWREPSEVLGIRPY